jgi:zinc transport system permease protein
MSWLPNTPPLAATLWERFWSIPVYQNALAAGMALAIICGLLSVFVVAKRMAFIGEGISHSAFGGAGLAYLLAVFVPFLREPHGRDLVIGLFAVTTALVIGRMAWRSHVSEDSAIGIALVAGMALGVVFLDLRLRAIESVQARGPLDPRLGGRPPLEDLLFGNLLNVTTADVPVVWGVAAAVLIVGALLFKELVFFAFDSEGATVFGVPAAAIHYGLLIALAVTVMVALRLLGVILASAFLVLPATVALLWSRRMGPVLAISAGTAVGSLVCGLALAMWLDFSVGPMVVLTLVAVLGMSSLAGRIRGRSRRRTAQAPALPVRLE